MLNKYLAAALLVLATSQSAASAQELEPGEIVAFQAKDGTELSGTWRGTSNHVVILSHQLGFAQEGWAPLVEGLGEAGYATLTYNFRGYAPSHGTFNPNLLDDDLRGAIDYAKSRGAETLTLVGASMGGIATVKVAAETNPSAYVILAAPRGFGTLRATDEALLAVSAPKLFINSERDTWYRDTRHMAEVAAEPKTLSIYPGPLHALYLFQTEHADQLVKEIVTFVEASMPL